MLSVINYAMGEPSLKSTVYLAPVSLFLITSLLTNMYSDWKLKFLKRR